MKPVNQQKLAFTSPAVIRLTLHMLVVIFGLMVMLSFVAMVGLRFTTDQAHLTDIIIQPIIIGIPFVLGWLIDRKHPGHTIALLFLVIAYSLGVGLIADVIGDINDLYPSRYANWIQTLTLTIGHIVWLPGVFFPLYLMPLFFPTGKLLSPRWRLLVIFILSHLAWWAIATIFRPWPWPLYSIPDTRTPNGIPGTEAFFDTISTLLNIPALLMFLLAPVAMLLRYRRADHFVRVQIKWPMYSIAMLLIMVVILWRMPDLSEFDAKYGYPFTWSMALLFPVSIGIAILRHNLFDIDIIINRTVVYGILTALIVLLYIAIVSVSGILVQAQTSVLSGLIATGIIAVIFQPLRDRLQRIVNRILYGERDEPAIIFSRLAHHLETADTPSVILPNLVQTIALTLKIPYVAVWLPAENSKMDVVAKWGKPPEKREIISLIYNNRTIGQLVVAPRSKYEHFTQSERALLTTIAALTASTVRAVQLGDELRRSRQRIVTAREEERRRIRRDLHDGLGPQLASQTLGLAAISQLMSTDPQKAQSLIASLQTQASEAIEEIRHLVYDLRPPALDDLGLTGAIEQFCTRYQSGTLHITIEQADLPKKLLAAIETAIFRIIQEALTNVVRHAEATVCIIRLYATTHEIYIEIEDDGTGLPDAYQSGIGLQTMCERAAELNGETTIARRSAGGTCVKTRIPLEVHHD